MALGTSGMLQNGWFVRPLTNVGGLNLPADLKTELGLAPGSAVFIRRFGPTVVIFPETRISPDTVMSATGLDAWIRAQIGAEAPPSAQAEPATPVPVSAFSLMLQGKPVAPTQPAASDQRLWTIPVDAKGHLTIPPELRRLLGQYGPGALLSAELRWDEGEDAPIPVICFRAVTSTTQQYDLASQTALLNRHNEEMAAREKKVVALWQAVEKRTEELNIQEEAMRRKEERANFLAMHNNMGAPPPPASAPFDVPPKKAAPGYKMVKTDLGWMEVADVDQELAPGEISDS